MSVEELLRLKPFLDSKAAKYNCIDFIEDDPISIPHLFDKKQDIEIMGFFAAVLAWGQRKTIINKCKELIDRMDGEPYEFVLHHSKADLERLKGFKHRTFNDIDLLYFVASLRRHYEEHASLEAAFLGAGSSDTVYQMLVHFKQTFFALPDFPQRSRKHVASPLEGSTCKRLNMFLRWMVRKDISGVDFGIWEKISSAQLMCPLDLHVDRVARKLGLLSTKNTNWLAVEQLTHNLKLLNPEDPIVYDFALFGLGIVEGYWKD
ncbi:MAG: TIGR02757 family protein [Chitinophagales bacterium]|nr:TIGR02757 family protein [Chitinophagales bacterium]